MEGVEVLENETCPVCLKKTLTLMDYKKDVPYFGTCYFFSMDCKSCNYHKADVETEKEEPPVKYTLDIGSEEDMKIRVIKSSNATVKIPHIGSIEPGAAANGYVTNVEGILNRIKRTLEQVRDNQDEDDDTRKKAKNLVKKLTRIMWGQEPAKLIIEDPTGNSAIVSDKAKKEKLAAKKKSS